MAARKRTSDESGAPEGDIPSDEAQSSDPPKPVDSPAVHEKVRAAPAVAAPAALTSAEVRKAVRSLLELAVAFEASQDHTNFTDVGFKDSDTVLDSSKTLRLVIEKMATHRQKQRDRANAVRVAELLPELVRG